MLSAQNAIHALIGGSVFSSYFRVTGPLASTALQSINDTINRPIDSEIEEFEIYRLKDALSQYKTALLAELGSFHSYLVSHKPPFDTLVLLAAGENSSLGI